MINKLLKSIKAQLVPPPEVIANERFRDCQLSANKILNDHNFLHEIGYDNLPESEQARVFNELITTALVHDWIALHDLAADSDPEKGHHWITMRDMLFPDFITHLKSIGVVPEQADIWQKLLDMRLEEYRQQLSSVREGLQEVINKEPTHIGDALVRIETVTIGTMLHITRGKAVGKTYLQRLIRTWLTFHNRDLFQTIKP